MGRLMSEASAVGLVSLSRRRKRRRGVEERGGRRKNRRGGEEGWVRRREIGGREGGKGAEEESNWELEWEDAWAGGGEDCNEGLGEEEVFLEDDTDENKVEMMGLIWKVSVV